MECISKLFGRVRHCFSHSTVGSSKTRQITIRGLELNTTNHDMSSIGLTQGISRNEVKVAISRMKNGKATGMDGIPVEVWKCLVEEGNLMQVIYEQEKIPTNGVESQCDYTYL